MDTRPAFGRALRRARDSRGMTQQKLGELSGYYPSVISELENGHMSPTFQGVYDICEALGYTTVQFSAFFDEEIALEKASGKT